MLQLLAPVASATLVCLATLASQSPVPLAFEPNRGQTVSGCEFLARAAGATLHLRGGAAEIRQTGSATTIRVVGANVNARLEAEDALPGHSNYLIGNDPTRWVHRVPHASRLLARAVLPGIDLRWRSEGGRLEYDFLLAAHADPAAIRIQVTAAVHVDARGRLVHGTGAGTTAHEAPVAWQDHGGERQGVSVAFAVLAPDQFGFSVGAYDPSLPLVIDPVLAFGTYLGGAGDDVVYDCEFDPAGNAVVSGLTRSVDFPTANALLGAMGGTGDAFAAKISADGSTLLWSTYLGGSDGDACDGYSLALDSTGRVFLSGITLSTDFPVTPGACQPAPGGGYTDGFFAVLAADGSHLDYATYFGGPGQDEFRGIAIHESGTFQVAYITGTGNAGFPTTPGAYSATSAGSSDAVLVCIAPVGGGASDLLYSTLIGGGVSDLGWGIAVDGQGHAHCTGTTWQIFGGSRFPTTLNAFHGGAAASRRSPNCYMHFYARIAPLGQGAADLRYATILENANGNSLSPSGLALGADGRVYLCGSTADTGYPTTTNAYQQTHKGGSDAFLTVLDPNLSGTASLVYSTLLGGTGGEGAYGVGLANGRVYLAGESTESGGKKAVLFPTTADAFQRLNAGAWDAFAAVPDLTRPAAQQIVYSTLFGGSGNETGRCLAVSSIGSMLIGGWTRSADLPVTAGAFDGVYSGNNDGYLIRID